MKPPKTAALWTQLERLGWRHDALPVATIMASYEAMELDLVAAKEQIASRNKRLSDMSKELDQARQDAKQSDLDAIRALGERNDARRDLEAERALADEMAGQLDHASLACDPGGCQKMLEAWQAARNRSGTCLQNPQSTTKERET